MTIAKGIKGIRAILAKNKDGWHVFNKTSSVGFFNLPLTEVMKRAEFSDMKIVSIAGNGIFIEGK